MLQREVQDGENVRWTCVQALGGVTGDAADQAAERVESADGTVPVVFTPSGGAETVRVELPVGWHEQLSDEQLLAALSDARR